MYYEFITITGETIVLAKSAVIGYVEYGDDKDIELIVRDVTTPIFVKPKTKNGNFVTDLIQIAIKANFVT